MSFRLLFAIIILIYCSSSVHGQVHIGFYNDSPPAGIVGPIELTTSIAFDQNLDVLRHASSTYCPWILLDPYMAFFSHNFTIEPDGAWSLRPPTLRADHAQCLRALKELVPANAAVDGFLLGDEPLWFGATLPDLTIMASSLRAWRPNSLIALVEAKASLTEGRNIFGKSIIDGVSSPPTCTPGTAGCFKVPADVDWVGFDWYGVSATQVRSLYNSHLIPRMHPHQKNILIPQAFANPDSIVTDEATCITRANQYKAWATSDSRVAAILPWHYSYIDFLSPEYGEPASTGEYGISSMPSLYNTYKAMCQQLVPSSSFTRFNGQLRHDATIRKNSFESFANDEPLPSTYNIDYWSINGSSVSEPTAPSINDVRFKRNSGNSYILIRLNNAGFRYRRTDYRTWDLFSQRNLVFDVWCSAANGLVLLDVTPAKWSKTPVELRIRPDGMYYQVPGRAMVKIASQDAFASDAWNRVRLSYDFGDLADENDNSMIVSLNESTLFAGPVQLPNVANHGPSPIGPDVHYLFVDAAFWRVGGPFVNIDNIGLWCDSPYDPDALDLRW